MDAHRRLGTVQAGRAIAAIAVVLTHATTLTGFGALLFKAGHAGVDFFFVLSGFIITMVHGKDVGRPHTLADYARKRLRRIYPPYWVASIIAILLAAAGWANSVNGGLVGLDWLKAVLLLPSRTGAILGVGWTLQHEMLFYAVFGVLILHRVAGLTLLAVWFGWSLAVALLYPLPAYPWALSNVWADFFGSSYHLQFGLGMLVAFLLSRRAAPFPIAWLSVGLALMLATASAENLGALDGLGQLARLAYGCGAALALVGLVQGEKDRRLSAPDWLVFLGEASYSIYLVHVPLMMAGITAWKPASGFVGFVAIASAGICGGCLLHLAVERPLLASRRRGTADTVPAANGLTSKAPRF